MLMSFQRLWMVYADTYFERSSDLGYGTVQSWWHVSCRVLQLIWVLLTTGKVSPVRTISSAMKMVFTLSARASAPLGNGISKQIFQANSIVSDTEITCVWVEKK